MLIRTRTLTFLASFLLLLTLLIPFSVFAKEVNLHEQPNATSKTIGSVDLATGIIPIFTPKGSDWIKVADPRNGNVGWISSSDIKDATGGATSFTFTQKMMNDGKGPGTYQVLQFGVGQPLTDEQQKRIEAQQQAFQHSVQTTVDSMVKNLKNLYTTQMQILQQNNMVPTVAPVVPVPAPVQNKAPAAGSK